MIANLKRAESRIEFRTTSIASGSRTRRRFSGDGCAAHLDAKVCSSFLNVTKLKLKKFNDEEKDYAGRHSTSQFRMRNILSTIFNYLRRRLRRRLGFRNEGLEFSDPPMEALRAGSLDRRERSRVEMKWERNWRWRKKKTKKDWIAKIDERMRERGYDMIFEKCCI